MTYSKSRDGNGMPSSFTGDQRNYSETRPLIRCETSLEICNAWYDVVKVILRREILVFHSYMMGRDISVLTNEILNSVLVRFIDVFPPLYHIT